jgi:hypothetical protein
MHAVIAAAVGCIALVASAPSAAAGVWNDLHRALRTPSGSGAGACRTTPPARVSGFPLEVRQAGTRLFGAGPVYVQLATESGLGVLDMRYSPISHGLRGQKSPMLVSPAYRGPILIRAWRLDGDGEARLSITNERAAELRIPDGKFRNRAVAGGWRGFPSALSVSDRGCYAWQIDGQTFSEVIVVRVRW